MIRSNNHPGDTIQVRGIPVPRVDVFAQQERLEAQLFDESMFATDQQKAACANVLRVLDLALYRWRSLHPSRDLPEYMDIGDRSWYYIPVHIFDPETTFPGRFEKPAWYRRKRHWRVAI